MSNLEINNAQHLIVVGGTSGIGLALALAHQQLGWQVSVVGHSARKIERIKRDYPTIQTYGCDLTDINQRQQLLSDLETVDFDRLIYSAGSYLNERVIELDKADSDRMLAVNLQAFQEVFSWASQQLKDQQPKRQQLKDQPLSSQNAKSLTNHPIMPKLSLICIASIAGTLDYPYASLYAKSKKAMIATASAYRLALAPYDIQVTCIAPGYVDTQALRDLNEGDASRKPFIMSTQKAVAQIMQAIDEDVELAIFPRPMRYLTRLLNQLPKPLLHRLLKGK